MANKRQRGPDGRPRGEQEDGVTMDRILQLTTAIVARITGDESVDRGLSEETSEGADRIIQLLTAINGQLDTMEARLDTTSAGGANFPLVADVFLDHGLQYVPDECLMGVTPGLSLVSRTFLERTRLELRKRCEKRHPALARASQHVTWPELRRFELGTEASVGAGERWYIQGHQLYDDIDVLMEISRDGSLVWSGVSNLRYSGVSCRPECTFWVPHRDFDVPLPEATDVFSSDNAHFPYLYWFGTQDCSLQQKAICKTLHCIHSPSSTLSPPSPLRVHVVFRRRSTGQMVTVLSTNEPDAIEGEDSDGQAAWTYRAYYCNDIPYGENDCVKPELFFDLFCSSTVDESAASIKFSSYPMESASSDNNVFVDSTTHARVEFYLRFLEDEVDVEDATTEEIYVRAMQSWRWG